MNWFRQNRFLGSFLITFGLATLISGSLLLYAKSKFQDATDQLNQTAAELSRLQNLNPFPNEPNLTTLKAQTAEYGVELGKLKEELKTRVLPVTAIQPNEFQSRLRQTVTAVTRKARLNKVKLPEKFFLGFDEFAAALPSNEAVPLLGQQLAQVELLADIVIDARVDALTAFKRGALPEEHGASATPTPTPARGQRTSTTATGPKLIERSVVELSFTASTTAARHVINQIASANKQFYIIRSLHELSEKDKGPPRGQETTESANPGPAAPSASSATKAGALTFIVGTEHIQTSLNIELIRFVF